jgi:hypothetical protein
MPVNGSGRFRLKCVQKVKVYCEILIYTILIVCGSECAKLHHILCTGGACTAYDVCLNPNIHKLRGCYRAVIYGKSVLDHLT